MKTRRKNKNLRKTRSKKQKGGEDQEVLNKKLLATARTGNTEKVINYLENGADINAKHKWNNYRPPLIEAALYGHSEIIEILLKKGADVNITDNSGNTALMVLVDYIYRNNTKQVYDKKMEIIERLLEEGIDLNIENEDDNTVRELIIIYERPDIENLLIDHVVEQTMQNHKEEQDKRLTVWDVMDNKKMPEKVTKNILNYGGKSKRKTRKNNRNKK